MNRSAQTDFASSAAQMRRQGVARKLLKLQGNEPVRPHRGSYTIQYRHNRRARHYIVRVDRPGQLTVTIPPKGTLQGARAFVANRENWIRQQMGRMKILEGEHRWQIGRQILWRGERVPLRVERTTQGWRALLGQDTIQLPWGKREDIITCLVRAIRRLASEELSLRTAQLALELGVEVRSVTIRDQRTRWGSCSARRDVSLNWRLMQAPSWVSDYVIVHELIHTRHFHHGPEYWQEVEVAFPRYHEAELWLKRHAVLLREPSQ